MYYIYRLDHKDGLFYIGYAKHPQSRFGMHWANCWKNNSKKDQFMRTTQLQDWRLTILAETPYLADARQIEGDLIEQTNALVCGLNTQDRTGLSGWVKKTGGARKGAPVSEETRAKQSAAKQGNTLAKDFHADPVRHAEWLATMKKLGKKVLCVTTGELFASVAEAASRFGVGRCDIRRVCNKQRNHVKHHKFTWVD